MGKHIGEKSKLIREAIAANPGIANANLARALNEQPHPEGMEFKPRDIAGQRQAMKPKDPSRKRKRQLKPVPAGVGVVVDLPGDGYTAVNGPSLPPANRIKDRVPVAASDPCDGDSPGLACVVDRLMGVAEDCGGWAELRSLADRLATIAGG